MKYIYLFCFIFCIIALNNAQARNATCCLFNKISLDKNLQEILGDTNRRRIAAQIVNDSSENTDNKGAIGFAPFRVWLGTNLNLLDGVSTNKLYAQVNY